MEDEIGRVLKVKAPSGSSAPAPHTPGCRVPSTCLTATTPVHPPQPQGNRVHVLPKPTGMANRADDA